MSLDIEKLKNSNNELREIVNNSWDGIAIIDKNSKFIYVNNAFTPILGFSKDEFLNSYFTSYIIENDKIKFEESINQNLVNKYSDEVQVVCIRKDKQKVYLQITLSLMLNKQFFVVNAKDITKQISDDEILDNYVISSHIDTKGNITKASNAFCLLSGYEKEELLGKSYFSLNHSSEKSNLFDEILKKIESNKEWNGKIKKLKKDDSIYWVKTTIKPIYNKYGDIVGYTILMFDITNELLLKYDKKILKEEVDVAQNQILEQQSKLEIMTQTLQMVSHQWRQPLNIISIQAQKVELEYSINETMDENYVIDTLNNIKNQANELSNTIENFQNFINIKSEKTDTNTSELIEDVLQNFNDDFIKKSIQVEKEIQKSSTVKIYKNELKTVLTNILTNAKEAIISNNVKNAFIKINQNIKDNKIYIEISNNGGGIKEELLDKIFEPYFSTKEQKHGVGLGLYMCKIIIEMHFFGKINVSSKNDETIFKIVFPIK